VEFPGLKNPSSKLPSLETKVLPSVIVSDRVMLSTAKEIWKKKKTRLRTINVKGRVLIDFQF